MVKYRLDAMLDKDTFDKVIELAKKEKRSKSAMARLLIEDGLKLVENEQTKKQTALRK